MPADNFHRFARRENPGSGATLPIHRTNSMSAFASETTRPMRKYSLNVLCSISSNFTRRFNAL